jgi:cytochrome c peroxidase
MKKYIIILFACAAIISFYFFAPINYEVNSVQYSEVINEEIVLCSTCPPGFQLEDNNRCISKNMYLQYKSIENKGVGGLKTALPEVRDGFSPQQIDLGRYLFFDPVLSNDNSISCASCHNPELGFSDGLSTSFGVQNKKVNRSSPSLWNVAYLKKLFWDARASTLEEQMEGPLYAENEMGTTRENLLYH